MIEMRLLKNVVIFIQTILNFVLSRKIINNKYHLENFGYCIRQWIGAAVI